ncbi:unnamed protein product [[Candida] boidinii]|nr:hypothetical protein B5S33_g4163 [[Candida] boidinii]GMF11301.1 unnamed protein product [[Candida] boidinii]
MLQSKQVALLLGQVLEPTPLSPNISPISISLITTSGTPLSSCINKKYRKTQLSSTSNSNSSINRDLYSDSTVGGIGAGNTSNGGTGYGSILDDSLTDNKSFGTNGYHSNNMKKDSSNLSGGAKSTGITSNNNDVQGDVTNATSGSGFQELDAQAYYEDVEEYISSNVNPGENLNIVALTAVNSWKKYLSTPANKNGDKKANWLCVAFEGDYVLYIHTIKNNDEYLLLMTCDVLYPRGLAIKQLDALSEAFSTRI